MYHCHILEHHAAGMRHRIPPQGATRAALEIFFFHNVAREMGQTMTDDMKELGLTREDYFRSLLDARYRQLIAKQALVAAKNGPGKRG